MIAGVVVDNLVYLVGAVVLAAVLGVAVTLRHRRPKSVEANMESFHRGLRALAPDSDPAGHKGRVPPPRPSPPRARTVQTVTPTGARPWSNPDDSGASSPLMPTPPSESPAPFGESEVETG